LTLVLVGVIPALAVAVFVTHGLVDLVMMIAVVAASAAVPAPRPAVRFRTMG
jgi:hypothetical protein